MGLYKKFIHIQKTFKEVKKIVLFAVALMATMVSVPAVAQDETESNVEFAYDAGAELVSAYLWRGQFNGGLSFQPDLAVGFNALDEKVSFRFGTWWSLGASDWGFRKGLEKDEDYNPNTYFVPEVDIYANFNLWGTTLGVTQYHFFDGNMFKNGWTELSVGYDLSTLTNIGLYANYNVILAGDDYDEEDKRCYSDYLAVGYNYEFENIGLTLGGELGITTHAGEFADKATVCNIQLRLEKAWNLNDVCELSIFGQGSINPYGVHQDKESVFIKASGDNKVCCQTLNGCIGLGVWF